VKTRRWPRSSAILLRYGIQPIGFTDGFGGSDVNELLRWEGDDGPVVVEIDSSQPGFQSISRKPGEIIHDVQGRFDDALENVRNAAVSALEKFRDEILDPDQVEIEFGVKFNAEAGAVIAKTSAEGHLTVKLTWSRLASD
jgi:hypothetical protein